MNFFDYLDEYNNRSRSSTPDSNTIASASTPIGQQDLSRLVSTSLEGPNGGASNTASTSSLRNSSTFSVLTNTTSSTPETNNNNNNNTEFDVTPTPEGPVNNSPTPTPEAKNPFDWKKAAKIAAIVVGVALVALAVLAILTGLSVIFPGAVPVLAALVGISAAAAGWTVFGVGVGAAVAGTTTALLAGYSLHTTSTKKTTQTHVNHTEESIGNLNRNSSTSSNTNVNSNPPLNNLDNTTASSTIQTKTTKTPTFNNLTLLLNTIQSNHGVEARIAAKKFINDYISENDITDLTQTMPLDLWQSLGRIFSTEPESSEPEKITRRNSMPALSDLDTHTPTA